MFGIGMPELIVILIVALLVIGPKKLPDLAKSLGRGFAEFRRASEDLRQQLDLEGDIYEDHSESSKDWEAKEDRTETDKPVTDSPNVTSEDERRGENLIHDIKESAEDVPEETKG